jgi:hypothetical protein
MTNIWIDKIIDCLLDSRADILFVIDPINLLQYKKIKETLLEKYLTIEKFQNEIQLRKLLKEKHQLIVIFYDKKQIPYDLLSTYATIQVDLNDIFPLLHTETLSQIPLEHYQGIYEKYLLLKDTKYERVSKEETELFIKEISAAYNFKEKGRITDLKNQLSNLASKIITDGNTWGTVSKLYGELMYLMHISNIEIDEDVEKIQSELNYKLTAFILKYYEDLIYHTKPQINSNLLNIIFDTTNQKNVVICFDCMGFEEWNAIKEYIQKNQHFECSEQYSFSMLPSETNYSSTALFSGLTPKEIKELDFIENISWRYEGKLFKYALKKRNIDESQVYFQRCIGPDEITIKDYQLFNDYTSIGIVFSFIDRFIHTDFLNDKKIILQNIKHYLEKADFYKLLQSLIDQNFKVYITSDHGNIFSIGNGIHVSKDLVDANAKRYLIQERKELLEEYKTLDSIIKQFSNINGNEYLLLQTGTHMYAGKNDQGLTHGGISISEVIIPFIEVKKHYDRV